MNDAPSCSTQHQSTPGINLISFFTANIGLGVAARSLAKTMQSKGVSFCINNLASQGVAQCPEEDYSAFKPYFSQTSIHPINIFLFGMDFSKFIYPKIKSKADVKHKFNALIPYWELFEYPKELLLVKKDFHVFLAPSRFIQYSLMRVVDGLYIDY